MLPAAGHAARARPEPGSWSGRCATTWRKRQRPGRVDRDAFVSHCWQPASPAGRGRGGPASTSGGWTAPTAATLYIGRLGLLDEDREPLLVDWRAPAAQPFYRATWAAPDGVVRRRRLHTRGRAVLGIEDDVLDLEGLSRAERDSLSGEAALLAALTASHTGRMTDIVATIQAEQDRIIRSGLGPGRAGRPGTARKTAVALRRRRSCSTPTASAWPGGACRQGRSQPRRSCVTSSRCRRWARPTCCCPPWASCSRASPPPRSRWPWPRSRATRA